MAYEQYVGNKSPNDVQLSRINTTSRDGGKGNLDTGQPSSLPGPQSREHTSNGIMCGTIMPIISSAVFPN
jgi:hypothetical protein